MDPVLDHIFSLAEPYLNSRHNLVHTRIVVGYAERIAAVEGGEINVIIPAAILHDVGWSEIPEELQLTAFGPKATNRELNRAHETSGVKIAKAVLDEAGHGAPFLDPILKIVDGHDSIPGAISLEDAVVKDADKLWRYSRTGFGIDCERFEITPAQSLSRLRAKLPDWFLTETGKAIAKEELESRENEVSTV